MALPSVGIWSIIGLITLWMKEHMSTKFLLIFSLAYIISIIIYTPQKKQGLPYWFYSKIVLNTHIMDPCLHYFDSIMLREGPELDPERKYIFAYMPHGILSICRLPTSGTCWPFLYPGVK